jgi:hypothetical protein
MVLENIKMAGPFVPKGGVSMRKIETVICLEAYHLIL